MNIKYSNKFSLFTVFLLLLIVLNACTGNKTAQYEKEQSLRYIDSLFQDLNSIKVKLDKVDFADIAERKEYVESELKLLSIYGDSTQFDPETIKVLEEFRAFSKMYRNLGRYSTNIVTETEELFIQLSTLRKSVENGDYEKEDFKKYLAQETKDVARLVEYVGIYIDPVIQTENLFFKRMEEVELITKKIKVRLGIE